MLHVGQRRGTLDDIAEPPWVSRHDDFLIMNLLHEAHPTKRTRCGRLGRCCNLVVWNNSVVEAQLH